MTEVNEQTMTREEFEEHHSRTWDYVARVGKIWERIAEEQQSIIDGKGYRHLDYNNWTDYWAGEFTEKTGWTWSAVKNWLEGRRSKLATESVRELPGMELGPLQWRRLAQEIKDPEDRADFIERYEEFKPEGSRYPFPEAIKEFKGESEKPGVIQRMREAGTLVAEYPSGTTREERAYNAASELLSVAMDVTPEAAADSISPGLAQTTAARYEVLIPWIQRFVGQLHHRAGRR